MQLTSIVLAMALCAALVAGCATSPAPRRVYKESQFSSRLESVSITKCAPAAAIELGKSRLFSFVTSKPAGFARSMNAACLTSGGSNNKRWN